jgi:hypothetical protein
VSDTPIERRYVMACTEADFHRLLGAAMGAHEFDPAQRLFSYSEAGRSWSLMLANAGERRIAQWHIALTEVTFQFRGYGDGEVEAALKKFFMYFQRGGG